MAVVTVKSARISGRDSTPPVRGGLTLGPRRLYDECATVEVTNGDSIASKFILATVPSHASMRELVVYCDAITSAAADFGVYRTTQDGGAVVDADAFGSAVSIATAITVGSNMARATPGVGVEGPGASLLVLNGVPLVTSFSDAKFALLSGRSVGEMTLNRFYVLHCVAIPLAVSLLIMIHFWRVRKDGGISGPM